MADKTYEVQVIVTVNVTAATSKLAMQIAEDWVGVTDNAPDSIDFVCADAEQAAVM